MSSIVGGWWSTKKRGRDDNAIKRDSEVAIARQKQHRTRKATKAISSGQPLRSETASASNDEMPKLYRQRRGDKHESSPPHWVKPPCSHRWVKDRHRTSATISPQREFFPNPRFKSNCTKNIRHPLIYSDRRSGSTDAIGCSSTRPSTRTIEHDSKTHVGIHAGQKLGHTRIFVTPEPHGRKNRKFFSALPLARTNKGDSKNNSKRNQYDGVKINFSSASKLRKLFVFRRKKERTLVGSEPDYERSAKLLLETNLRHRKFITITQGARSSPLRSANCDGRNDHAAMIVYGRKNRNKIRRAEASDGSRATQVTTAHSKSRSDDIRSLRISSNTIYTRKASSREEESPKFIFREGFGSIEQPEIDATTRGSITSRKFCTQEKDSKPRSIPMDRPPCHTKQSNIHLGEEAANKHKPHRGTLVTPKYLLFETKITNKSVEIDTFTNCFPMQHHQQFNATTEKLMATPSQTPSTAPSAVLSLPVIMADHSLPCSPLSSEKTSFIDGKDFYCDLQPRRHPSKILSMHDDGDMLTRTTSRNLRKQQEQQQRQQLPLNPLRDIEFWQQIALNEGGQLKKTIGGDDDPPQTFKHTFAALVIAKNSTFTNEKIKHNNEFLWLPSTLGGGTNDIGLANDGM